LVLSIILIYFSHHGVSNHVNGISQGTMGFGDKKAIATHQRGKKEKKKEEEGKKRSCCRNLLLLLQVAQATNVSSRWPLS
jgi:hypothetical protein